MMHFNIVGPRASVEEVNQVWGTVYADLYRESNEERASDYEILADVQERLKVLTTPDDEREVRIDEL